MLLDFGLEIGVEKLLAGAFMGLNLKIGFMTLLWDLLSDIFFLSRTKKL